MKFCSLCLVALVIAAPVSQARASGVAKTAAEASATPNQAAKAPDLAAELGEIQRNKPPQQGFASAFTTRFVSARNGKVRISQGQVTYQPPGRFKWEIRDPVPEVYVSNGQVLWQHTPAQKHAKRLTPGEAGLEFLQAITDPQALSARYVIEPWGALAGVAGTATPADSAASFDALPTVATKNPATPAKLLAKLTPKVEGTPEDYLYLIADRASGQIDEIRIAFRNGNKNIISFEKWSKSKAGPKTFEFVPPPGTAVD